MVVIHCYRLLRHIEVTNRICAHVALYISCSILFRWLKVSGWISPKTFEASNRVSNVQKKVVERLMIAI